MRHVQHQHRLARHDLEATGQRHQGQPVAHRLRRHRQHGAQCLQRRQHTGGVEQLVRAAQRRVGQPGIPAPAPGPGPLLAVAAEVEVAAQQPGLGAYGFGLCQQAGRRHRVADDDRTAGAHDAGFLEAYALAVRAKEVHVVQVDVGDDGAIGIDDVDRIQAPAQPHLQNRHVQPGLAHQAQDGQRAELEIGQADFFTVLGSSPLHSFKLCCQIRSGSGFAQQTATFLEMHQMRRGVDAGAVARMRQDRLQHRTGRALAIGAGHGDDRAVKAQFQAFSDPAHAVQAHVNRVRMQALAMRQPVLQSVHRPIVEHAPAAIMVGP